ncbi:MAG TPA: hypothetical protein VI251_10705 [Pseudolabrys sp.]
MYDLYPDKRRTLTQTSNELQEIVMAERAAALTSFVAAALVAATAADASARDGTAEQRWACEHDALTFCSRELPDVDRITACMVNNLKKLSPRCRAQFREPAAASESTRSAHDVW